MKCSLDDKPGLAAMLLYGLQWWVVTLPSLVITGVVVSHIHYADVAAQTMYVQKLFAVMGLSVMAQVLWGHRLPLVTGPASVLLVGIMSTLPVGIPAIYTAIAVGGAMLSLLAWSGLLHRVHGVFTPRVVAVILMLIAVSMTPVIVGLVTRNTARPLAHLFFCLVLVLALVLANKHLRGLGKATTLLWGMVLGSAAHAWLFPPEIAASVTQGAASATQTAAMPGFFLPALVFDPGALLAFLFCFVALIINELGSIEGVGQMLGADTMRERTRRGVGLLGISNMVSGALGVIGPVDFSLSTGVIAATRCASRYTLLPAGAALVVCAFFPSVIRLLASIPAPVMGALMLYLMATQLGSGLSIAAGRTLVFDFSSSLTLALPLMVALLITNTPPEVFATGMPLLRPIVGNGFVMGCLCVLLLEHVVVRAGEGEGGGEPRA